MKPALDPASVTARLQAASDLADLRPEHRLDAKLDLRPEAVSARLRIAGELRDLCRALGRAGAGSLLGSVTVTCSATRALAKSPKPG